MIQYYNFQTLCCSSEKLFHLSVAKPNTASSLCCYTKLPLFLEDITSSAYFNDFFCYILSKVGEWWVANYVCWPVLLT